MAAPYNTNPPLEYDESTKVYHETFSYVEFLDYCMNTPRSSGAETVSEQVCNESNPWSGTQEWQQAVDYAYKGWDAGINKIKEFIETSTLMVNVENNIIGHGVDVGRYLMGLPDNMVNFVDDTYRNKAPLTIYTKLDYNGDVNGSKAMKFSSKVVETIMLLNSTFNIELVGCFFDINRNIDKNMVLVKIKGLDENFVLNNLAFAFHPAFFRRFWFKWIETKNFFHEGYGRSYSISGEGNGFEKDPFGKTMKKILRMDQHQYIYLPEITELSNFDPLKISQKAIAENQKQFDK